MDVLRPPELRELLSSSRPPCVSMYLPTHRRAPGEGEAALRLRMLLGDARAALDDLGLGSTEIDGLLAPATRLLADRLFWEQQGDGLAILLAADRWQRLRLPFPVPELVSVGERFSIHPLVELLADRRFLLLALSQRLARLFTTDPWSMRELEVEGLPHGVVEDLPLDQHEESLQVHGAITGPGSEASFHGHGGAKDAAAVARERYLRAVDHALHPALRGRTEPLVVAGVRSVVAEFAGLTGHGPIIAQAAGNVDRMPLEELHAAAWVAAEPLFLRRRDEALRRYTALAGTGRTSDRLEEVVEAASQGRVETLLVPPATAVASGDADTTGAVEEAITATVLHRGEVHLVAGGSWPDLTVPAAILRY
jgi:hypothetical protein